jgi:hypothetical protein
VFFPETITKERHYWGMSMARTDGAWRKYKLVYGDLERLRLRIRAIAGEYSTTRQRNPQIDVTRLFEEAPSVRGAGVDYFDYAGRIDTVTREAAVVQYPSGSRIGLNRDMGFGFRGILVRSDEPWSMEQFAMTEMQRFRHERLQKGIGFRDLGVEEPWRLRQAAENYLRALFSLAWNEYATEQTMDRFEAVIAVEKAASEYALDSLRYAQFLGDWEFMRAVPFPDRTGALQLWEQARIRDLVYDETAPWWMESPAENEVEVTAARRFHLNTGKGVNITVTTNPELKRKIHPHLDLEHHLISYGQLPFTAVGMPQNVPSARNSRPIIQKDDKGREVLGWGGEIPIRNEWSSLQENGPVPEPKLKVRSRLVQVPQHLVEQAQAALSIEKPVLWFPHDPGSRARLNGTNLPILVLPRIFATAMVVPLFGGGRVITPIEGGNKIEGWVTQTTGRKPNVDIWGPTPNGFLTTPLAGRPIREGALQEMLP